LVLEKAKRIKKSIDGRDKTIDCRTIVMRRVIVVWDATTQARRRGRSPFALSKKVVQDETTMTSTGHWVT
jgi:hypothetical protein